MCTNSSSPCCWTSQTPDAHQRHVYIPSRPRRRFPHQLFSAWLAVAICITTHNRLYPFLVYFLNLEPGAWGGACAPAEAGAARLGNFPLFDLSSLFHLAVYGIGASLIAFGICWHDAGALVRGLGGAPAPAFVGVAAYVVVKDENCRGDMCVPSRVAGGGGGGAAYQASRPGVAGGCRRIAFIYSFLM